MLPDRVSNPGPLTYESGALPIALRGPARVGLTGVYIIISFGKKTTRKVCLQDTNDAPVQRLSQDIAQP